MYHIGKHNQTQANINPMTATKIAIENIVCFSPLLHILIAFFDLCKHMGKQCGPISDCFILFVKKILKHFKGGKSRHLLMRFAL